MYVIQNLMEFTNLRFLVKYLLLPILSFHSRHVTENLSTQINTTTENYSIVDYRTKIHGVWVS